jgi:hypothetical protein
LTARRVLVTGAASGIGLEASLLERFGYHASMRLFGRSAAEGARSVVYAATESGVVGGGYYGPSGFGQTAGGPGRVRPSRRALDEAVATRLWEASERLTGVRYAWDDRVTRLGVVATSPDPE